MPEDFTFNKTGVNMGNTNKRLPVVFCLDTSSSMKHADDSGRTRISLLNGALKSFIEDLKTDSGTKNAAEIAIVTFDDVVTKVMDFQEVKSVVPKVLEPRGLTHMGEGILYAVNLINERRQKYYKKVSYFVPYLVIITDGHPEGEDASVIETAIDTVIAANKADTAEKILYTFTIGVGNHTDTKILNRLAHGGMFPDDKPLIYDGRADFAHLFKIISKSASRSALRNHSPQQQKSDIQNALKKGLTGHF